MGDGVKKDVLQKCTVAWMKFFILKRFSREFIKNKFATHF